MTSTASVPHCSTASDCPAEVQKLSKDITPASEMPETIKKCEHTIRSQKQFTHLPVNCEAALNVRLSKEDVPKCDECAILEDIVANRCEKCLFIQELASQRSKSCEPKSLPASRRSSLTKGKAPPLPRTETEAELLVCPPVVRTQPQNVKQHALINDKIDVPKEDKVLRSLPGLIADCSSVEVFKRDKLKSQFAGSNVYVIKPTFKQIVRPLTYQATKGVQCDKMKNVSLGKERSPSYNGKNGTNKDSEQKDCEEDFLELDSGSTHNLSGSESSSNQEEKTKTKAQPKQKLQSKSRARTRCVLIQCNLPGKRSKSKSSKPKLKTRSKSVSPTKTNSPEYELPKGSLSELCLGSSDSELSEKSKDVLPLNKEGSVESDTEIVIEEKIYVKCPTDSIRKKKITTGNKSILLRKSLASDIRSLLCEEKLLPSKKSSEQLDSKKLDMRTASPDKLCEGKKCLNKLVSSDEKKSCCSRNSNFARKSPLPGRKSAFSRKNSVSSDKKSCLSLGTSEHSDSGSSQEDGCDCSDEKPNVSSDHSRVFDEKCVCFDETSIASHKQKAAKNHDGYESDVLEQSESDFCSDFCRKSDKRRNISWKNKASERNCCAGFQEKSGNRRTSHFCESKSPEKSKTTSWTREDNRNKRRSRSYEYRVPESESDFSSFCQKFDSKRRLSFESEALEQSENDYCAPFRRNNDNNTDWCLATTDSDDFHSCSEVDSNALRYATRTPRIANKSYNNVSEKIDIEACKEAFQGASQGRTRTHSGSNPSVFFKIIGMSRISCIFMALIILIILFSIAMLAWRIIRDKE